MHTPVLTEYAPQKPDRPVRLKWERADISLYEDTLASQLSCTDITIDALTCCGVCMDHDMALEKYYNDVLRCLHKSRLFKCSLDMAKRSFYRAANAVFGKIGRFASDEVVLKIIHSKCVPILLYGLEACPLNKADLNSLDFVINRFL